MSNPTNRRMSTNFHVLLKYCWNRKSSVHIGTRILVRKTGIRIWFSAGARKFSLPHSLLDLSAGAKRVEV
jgi:hypothetical protein